MHIAIHSNPTQRHQREHAQWLIKGFKRHGLDAIETHDVNLESHIHVVSGPHYAKDRWINHPRTILLDRAYYHAEKSGKWQSMDYVSLGWLRPDGGRCFKVGSGREIVKISDKAASKRSIFLTDYGCSPEKADGFRMHPANKPDQEEITQVLRRYGVAIGYKTSALVTAGIMGLDIICKDSSNIMFNDNWKDLLPYADWRYSEIDDAIEHLMLV